MAEEESANQQVTDKKDLAALWAVGLLFSLLLILVGSSWNPSRYEAKLSKSVDPLEAQIENGQNRRVADAINAGKVEYHPTMEKLVQRRPLYEIALTNFLRLLISPTGPIVIVWMLIRKTVAHRKTPKSN